MLVVLVAIIVLMAVVARLGHAPSSSREGVPSHVLEIRPDAALGRITSHLLQAPKNFTLVYKDATIATFTRRKGPNTDIAIVLLILGIVPGLLYIGLYRGTQMTNVMAEPAEDGCVVYLSGDDKKARHDIARWIKRELR